MMQAHDRRRHRHRAWLAVRRLAFIVKGTPMKGGRRAWPNAPNTIMLVVRKDGRDQDRRRPQGQEGRRLDRRLADLLAVGETVALRRAGAPTACKIVPLGADAAQVAALKTKADRRRDHRQRHGRIQHRRRGQRPRLAEVRRQLKDFHVHVIYATDKADRRASPTRLTAVPRRLVRDHRASCARTRRRRIGDRAGRQNTDVLEGGCTAAMTPPCRCSATTGHFKPKALAVLAPSFVEMKTAAGRADMRRCRRIVPARKSPRGVQACIWI